jgi:hypothetical protein
MSLFRDENPYVGVLTFDPQVLPANGYVTGGLANSPTTGAMWHDASKHSMQTISMGGLYGVSLAPLPNTTGVTNTNATSATALMTTVFSASSLSSVGKTLYMFSAGEYTTDSGTGRTITLAVTINDGTNTRTLVSWTSGATTASQTSMPWNFEAYMVVTAAGASGTMFSHGTADITLGASAGGATTAYNDTNTANSSVVILTASTTLSVTQLFSGSNAGNTFTQDMMIIEVLN